MLGVIKFWSHNKSYDTDFVSNKEESLKEFKEDILDKLREENKELHEKIEKFNEKLEKNNEKLNQIFSIKRISDEDSDDGNRSPQRHKECIILDK